MPLLHSNSCLPHFLILNCFKPEHNRMMNPMLEFPSFFLSRRNYVVQYVLDLKDPWATAVVLKQLMGNYEHLSVQKYSSNVVEKCLKLTKKDDFSKIIQELLRSPLLSQILQDPYGNYVMQTTLIESKVFYFCTFHFFFS